MVRPLAPPPQNRYGPETPLRGSAGTARRRSARGRTDGAGPTESSSTSRAYPGGRETGFGDLESRAPPRERPTFRASLASRCGGRGLHDMTTNARRAVNSCPSTKASPRAFEALPPPVGVPRAAATARRPTEEIRHPDFAPSWLMRMWLARRAGVSCACPDCPAGGPPLGLAVHEARPAYRLQCAVCGWRSSWFEPLADGRVVAIWLDVA